MKTLKLGALALGMLVSGSVVAMDLEFDKDGKAIGIDFDYLDAGKPVMTDTKVVDKKYKDAAADPLKKETFRKEIEALKKYQGKKREKAVLLEDLDSIKEEREAPKGESLLTKVKAFPGACLRSVKSHPWISGLGTVVVVAVGTAAYVLNKQAQAADTRNSHDEDDVDTEAIVE